MGSFLSGIPILSDIISGAKELISEKIEDKDLANRINAELDKKIQENSADFEREVTKRWQSDKDGFLTRNIRPLAYAFVMVLLGAAMLTDGNIGQFTIKAAYIPVIENLLWIMTVAYFGSRGVEKGIKLYKGGQENK